MSLAKRSVLSLLRSPVFTPLAALIDSVGDHRSNVLRILTYHRVDEPRATPHLAPCTLSATPATFRQQMQLLADKFRVVHVDQVIHAVRGQSVLPQRSVLITFDDAYVDFQQNAWPVLQELKLPALMFVPTAYPGQPARVFWWDALYHVVFNDRRDTLPASIGSLPTAKPAQQQATYRRLQEYLASLPFGDAQQELDRLLADCSPLPATGQVMSWETLRRLHAEGLAIGVHTQTHPVLDRIPSEAVAREVRGACEDLEREIGDYRPILAYPGGHYNGEVIRAVREAGIEFAVTTQRGANVLSETEAFALRRINVGMRATTPMLRTQLSLPAGLLSLASH